MFEDFFAFHPHRSGRRGSPARRRATWNASWRAIYRSLERDHHQTRGEGTLNVSIALLIGLVAGTHVSTWGMYKDAIHEGFTWPKYFRSIAWSAARSGSCSSPSPGWTCARPGNMVVFFGLVYAVERLLLELWKSFIRVEDQSKYFIPMRFGIRGKPVMNNRIRWSVGVGRAARAPPLPLGRSGLQRAYPDLPPWLVLVTIGSLGGWLTAFGGAWKDAPVEGFETLKFFRSPGISLIWAMLVAFFTDNWLFIGIAGRRLQRGLHRDVQDLLLPEQAARQVRGQADSAPGHARIWARGSISCRSTWRSGR
jgi:hypothetical protein